MNAFRCDRCGEHYDGEPPVEIVPNPNLIRRSELDRFDLCQSCWAMIRSTIGTAGKPNVKATA